ncbi:MAG TPA: sigma-70 family RNA polymerase sigma factor [Planctomycetota bacterium]|nr:sigma-70 family RNA polymerase sigma factor [Planctomycetota bacterium]
MTTAPSEALNRLLAEEPFVRQLAHSLLDEEADDAIQQMWLQAVRDGGHGVAKPRSWLARILFNVANNLRQHEVRRNRREREASGPTPAVPSPAELVEREESRRQLVDAVNELPAQLRTAVLMRYFDGLPPRRVAQRLGVPVATVWNQLRRALQLLRERLDARHDGDRRAWLLALIPFAVGAPQASPPPSSVHAGARSVMPAKAALTAVAAIVVAAAGVVALWASSYGGTETRPEPRAAGTASVASDLAPPADRRATAPERSPVASAPASTLASALVVHVRHAEDTSAAGDVMMLAVPRGGDPRVDALRARTGADGAAHFEGLAAGTFHVFSDRCDPGKKVEVDGTSEVTLDYDLPVGITVKGIVLDRSGAPVANALLDLAPLGRADIDAETIAAAGADGRFVLRSLPGAAFVGARANEHASSVMQFVSGQAGSTVDVRLRLGAPAGAVSGVVVDAEGRPVPRAILRIGSGRTTGLAAAMGEPPVPATVHTDAHGRFTAVGIPTGTQNVVARAAGRAPWRGTCEVTAAATASLRVQLASGATIRGTVRDATGAALADATVQLGDPHDLASFQTSTSSTGTYELTGLPAGEVLVSVSHARAGRAERTLTTTAGTASACDLQTSIGLALRGRVVDANGAAVARAVLDCAAFGAEPWIRRALTDAEGRFVVPDCPADIGLTITVKAAGMKTATRRDVDPTAGPIELTLASAAAASVKIRGTVVDAAGEPLAGIWVRADDGSRTPGPTPVTQTGAQGRFELGPFVPGTYRVIVNSPRYPVLAAGPRELDADAVWDLDKVVLATGGTVAARVTGDVGSAVFVVVDAAGAIAGSFSSRGPTPLVSNPLAAGDYRLCVQAPTATADAVAFTIRPGATTEVTVGLRPAVRQQFQVSAAALASPPNHVTLRVHRGTELVTAATCSFRNGPHATKELGLAPGPYRVTVCDGGRELAAIECEVTTAGSVPVQVELR